MVVQDGRRWVDFEVGDRSEATFLKLYTRLPEAQRYVSDGYRVYEWLPHNRHMVRKGLEANRNEGLHAVSRDKLNPAASENQGLQQERAILRDSIAWSACAWPNLIPTHIGNTSQLVPLTKT